MKTTPRKFNRRAWLVVAIPLGAGAIWALAPGDPANDDQQASDETERSAGQPSRLESLGQAMDLLRKSGPEAQAAPASHDLVSVLFSGDDAPSRLGLVLTAVAANPTPPELDPLWPELVQGISSLWNTETLTWGLDLMLSEARPRARRAVVSSLTKLATSERSRLMTPDQRQTLIEHFIDLYQQTPTAQQPEVLAAMRKIGATDAADVLMGRGLDSDDSLQINREHKSAVQQTVAQVKEAEARESAAQAQAQVQAAAQAQAQAAAQAQAQAAAEAQAQAPAAAAQVQATSQGQQGATPSGPVGAGTGETSLTGAAPGSPGTASN